MKVKISKKQHNRIFKYRQTKWLTYYEIIDDSQKKDIEMYQYVRLHVRILCILFSPLAMIIGGLPAVINLIKECYSKKQVGADIIDRDWFYKELNK